MFNWLIFKLGLDSEVCVMVLWNSLLLNVAEAATMPSWSFRNSHFNSNWFFNVLVCFTVSVLLLYYFVLLLYPFGSYYAYLGKWNLICCFSSSPNALLILYPHQSFIIGLFPSHDSLTHEYQNCWRRQSAYIMKRCKQNQSFACLLEPITIWVKYCWIVMYRIGKGLS